MNAVVVRVFPIEWNSYFKVFQLRFRCRCPACGRINKHGDKFDSKPSPRYKIVGTRACDFCRMDYAFNFDI